MKECFFNIPLDDGPSANTTRWYVLIIYDIPDNRKRTRLAKLLSGYGFRIQKSAFEAILTKPKYTKMLQALKKLVNDEDNIRIYRIRGIGEVTIFGSGELIENEDVVVL
jgi:CRISPR-associated endonuclease Cas2